MSRWIFCMATLPSFEIPKCPGPLIRSMSNENIKSSKKRLLTKFFGIYIPLTRLRWMILSRLRFDTSKSPLASSPLSNSSTPRCESACLRHHSQHPIGILERSRNAYHISPKLPARKSAQPNNTFKHAIFLPTNLAAD